MTPRPDGRYHASERPSLPPSDESLRQTTERHRVANDSLERRVGGEPLPAAVAVAALDLSDEQRLAAYRELEQRWYESGLTHLDQVMTTCQREARARIVAAAKTGGRGT